MGYTTLTTGCAVQLRRVTRADLEPLLAFFASLSADDRRYLRRDVTDIRVVAELLREAERGAADRTVALCDGEIVGFAALLFEEEDWHRHLGEIRVIVGSGQRLQGLGTLLVSAMIAAAERRGLSKVVVKMPERQAVVQTMFEHLGFRVDAVLPDHVLDQAGARQALVIMSCSLDSVSRELRDSCRDDDWLDG